MFSNENITRYFNDESERRLLDRSYKVLISNKFSTERKLTAVEYLYRFVHMQDHRDRLQILYQRELNPRVKKHLKDALDGTLFNFLKERYENVHSFDDDLEEEFEKNKAHAKTKMNKEIQNSISYMKFGIR